MKTRTWKIDALLLALVGFASQLELGAQTLTLPYNLTFSNNANVTYSIDTSGTLSESGPLSSNPTPYTYTFSGNNPQLLWMPTFSALRAGLFSGTQTIGQYSVAIGSNALASNQGSFSQGNATASGPFSLARGISATASNAFSTAMGIFVTASGSSSTAIGGSCTAVGNNSTALGSGYAIGNHATVLGSGSAGGNYSTVLGNGITNGDYSTATGSLATANSYSCFALGQLNVGLSESGATPSQTTWVSGDPVFEIGNGTVSGNNSDALVVYKNGDVAVHTKLRCAATGDLSMGSFTAGTAP